MFYLRPHPPLTPTVGQSIAEIAKRQKDDYDKEG